MRGTPDGSARTRQSTTAGSALRASPTAALRRVSSHPAGVGNFGDQKWGENRDRAHLVLTAFGPDRYDSARAELLDAADATRRRALAPLLPTSNQISTAAGGWDAALRLAALDVEQPDETPAEPRPRTKRASRAVPVPDAIALYLEYQGHLPSRRDLQWFREAANFVMADETARPWSQFIAMFREAWTARGRWAPPGVDRRRQRQPVPADGIPGVPQRKAVSIERCVEAVALYWNELPARLEPTQKKYGAWAVGTEHPAPSRFQQFGGFAHIRELARERLTGGATPKS